jgi:hypothetical protein
LGTPVYVVNAEGIELRHHQGEYTPTTIFISKTTGFRDLYQEPVSETPIAPTLSQIEQMLLKAQGHEGNKGEEQNVPTESK